MSVVRAIIDKLDIVDYVSRYTQLKKTGNTLRGACPICGGDNPTELAIYNDKKYHCFKCKSSGNVINFYADYNRVSYDEAIRVLANELNIDIKKDQVYCQQLNQIQQNELEVARCEKNLPRVIEYLKKRGLTDETIKNFRLGANDNAIVIPLRDINGRTVAFAYRKFDGKPKYINSKNSDIFDKSEYLYNLDRARRMINDKIYLVEGYFDAMVCDQAGVPAVAYCGIEISKEQIIAIDKLAKLNPYFTVIWVPDNDGKAVNHLPKVRERIMQYAPRLIVRVALLPDEIKDMNDYILAGGKIEDLPTVSLDEYVLKLLLLKCTNKESEYQIAEQFLRTVKYPIIKTDIIKMLSERWGKSEKEIKEWFNISSITTDDIIDEFKDPFSCANELVELVTSDYVQYGFPALDKALRGGARKGEVTFIGANPSVGKTMLVVQTTIDLILRQNRRVLFFSLEMSAGALYERIIANLAGKPTTEIEKLVKAGDPFIYQVIEKLNKRLYVIDTNNLSVDDIEKRIQIANARLFDAPVDVIIIDYLQYMKNTTGYEEISVTARQLKPLAKNNNIHVICLSQLNRGAVPWERPTMNQLKGAGDIEATGDIILVMWKPSTNPKLSLVEKEAMRNTIMLGVEKARRGALADEFELMFNPQETRVREVIANMEVA